MGQGTNRACLTRTYLAPEANLTAGTADCPSPLRVRAAAPLSVAISNRPAWAAAAWAAAFLVPFVVTAARNSAARHHDTSAARALAQRR